MAMLRLDQDSREFIALLNSHDVRYVIVGGHAVAFHGYPRFTGDVDVFVEVSEENARKLEAVLSEFGFSSLGLSASDFLEPDTIIQLGNPPNRIDLITSLSGVSFSSAWGSRVRADLDGLPVFFVSKEILLTNKTATGRPKDLTDLNELTS